MEREILKRYLADGLSLERIGELVQRDASTVGYWVAKHGLEAVNREAHAPKGGIARERLEPLVAQGLSSREIADRLELSQATVRYWLRRHGMRTARARRPEQLCGKYVEQHCRVHGRARFVLEGRGYYRCTRCRSERVAARRRRIKQILVSEAGGVCAICGYGTYIGALEFHHLDPDEKSFGLAMGGCTRGIAASRAEARKCVLLCSNCHAEVGAGLISATLVA